MKVTGVTTGSFNILSELYLLILPIPEILGLECLLSAAIELRERIPISKTLSMVTPLPEKSWIDPNRPDGIRFELQFPSCWNGERDGGEACPNYIAYLTVRLLFNAPVNIHSGRAYCVCLVRVSRSVKLL